MSGLPLDYFIVSEIKLDRSFPSAQFRINECKVKARRDRVKKGVETKIEFIKKDFICNQSIEKIRTKI